VHVLEVDILRRFAETDLEQQAAQGARGYMEALMERYSRLTPRDGVHLFFSYFDGYLDGALLRAARRAARDERIGHVGHPDGEEVA
jgi:hypothetical protein